MRKKLKRFQDNAQRNNVIEPGKANYHTIKGQWKADYFHNFNDIILELGCGEGEYSINLAKMSPTKNFVGIDLKGARLWAGSTQAVQGELKNVAFLRAPIEQIDQFFAPGEVDEIYLPFPDPRPRDRDEKKRLTSPGFLDLYRKILRPGGKVHLKTDNDQLFAYTLEVLRTHPGICELVDTQNLYEDNKVELATHIQTKYERKYLSQGIKIKYLQFVFGKAAIGA
jgi:tRNA (guanine-N7-)-methyltransferase